MQVAPIPHNENARVCALHDLHLLDTVSEERFDHLTKKAVERFAVSISTVTLIDKDREWFKSTQGQLVKEGPREISFCGHALLSPVVLVVEDTLKDFRFVDNPMVIGEPFIRFYAGKSLYNIECKMPVGVFCIKDHEPREMSITDIADFLELADLAEKEINKKVGN